MIDYSRQSTLNLTIPQSPLILGVGGIGSNLAFGLAMSGCSVIQIADSDVVESHNLNRCPFLPNTVGMPKTEAIARTIKLFRPACLVVCYASLEPEDLSTIQTDLIFDCTDRHSMQIATYQYASANRIPYVRTGYDGTHISVVDKISSWVTNIQAGQTAYNINPSWFVPSSLVAMFGIAKAMKFPDLRIVADIGSLGKED